MGQGDPGCQHQGGVTPIFHNARSPIHHASPKPGGSPQCTNWRSKTATNFRDRHGGTWSDSGRGRCVRLARDAIVGADAGPNWREHRPGERDARIAIRPECGSRSLPPGSKLGITETPGRRFANWVSALEISSESTNWRLHWQSDDGLGNARFDMYERCEGCKRCEGCQRRTGTGPRVVSANNFLAKTASAASHMERRDVRLWLAIGLSWDGGAILPAGRFVAFSSCSWGP
jgi:hypothetical protein